MSGYSEKQLNCKHKRTKSAKVGLQKQLKCLDCLALLTFDKKLKTISVSTERP